MPTLAPTTAPPKRYRVVYQLHQAQLHLGRPVGRAVQRCSALVTTNELAVLLVDLFEHYRGQPDFLGLQVLSISRRLPASQG